MSAEFALDDILVNLGLFLNPSLKLIRAQVEVLNAGDMIPTGDAELDKQRIDEGKKKNHWTLRFFFKENATAPPHPTAKPSDISGVRISMDVRAARDGRAQFASQCIVKFTNYTTMSNMAITAFPVQLGPSVTLSEVLAVAKSLDSSTFNFRQVGDAAMGCRDWVLAFWAGLAIKGYVVGMEDGTTIMDVITSRYWPVESDIEDESADPDGPNICFKLVDSGIWTVSPPPHHQWIRDQGRKLEEVFEMFTVA
ncbi:hypothetical protein GGR54DRAFT_625447 [Hypoxylon sp. NC1633]|nr:hypothetical protein GGR54DRAFT_625447 [Hypoxylon sp. NC1633]